MKIKRAKETQEKYKVDVSRMQSSLTDSTNAEQIAEKQVMKVPLNLNMEVKKNVSEAQTMKMSQTQSMVVGGNKVTFNIDINITVEPVE